MISEEQWRIVHKYRHMAARNLVEPMTCPNCTNSEYLTPRLGQDGGVVLKCYDCGAQTYPGLNWFETLKDRLESLGRSSDKING